MLSPDTALAPANGISRVVQQANQIWFARGIIRAQKNPIHRAATAQAGAERSVRMDVA